MRVMRFVLWALIVGACAHCVVAAPDAEIKGIVTDSTGKPIRGARVTVTMGIKSTSRYSQKDGSYQITVPAGSYSISAEAFGFAPRRQEKQADQKVDVNFSLPAQVDVNRLTGAEIESILPDNAETRRISVECISCHNLEHLTLKRGSTAEEWRDFLPTMTRGRYPVMVVPQINPAYSQAKFVALTDALGKYFGPDATYLSPDSEPPTVDRIQHPELSDAAMTATFTEYQIPTAMPMAHSMSIDPVRRIAWWGEESHLANKIGRFNMDSETFQEYPVPTQNASVHTGIVVGDGRYFVTLPSGGASKMASVDPDTGKLTEYKWPEKQGNPHTLALDKEGNIWMSGGASGEIWSFDLKTQEFGTHKFTVPANYPDDSIANWMKVAGDPPPPVRAVSYDIRVDSKGKLWFTVNNMGTLFSLDPATGETKQFKPANTPSMRGMTVDAQDNVWFSNFQGHQLGKLDGKTGQIKEFQPPIRFSTPYGFVVDEKKGYVWFSDLNGNAITRFDRKTEQFVEYPIPTREAGAKFMALDPEGRVWFTEVMGAKIGMLDPDGASR
jgi:streptogramin lyase